MEEEQEEPVQVLAQKGIRYVPRAYIRPLEERSSVPHNAYNLQMHIPVVDLLADDVSEQVGQACTEWGFFQVLNHGVPRDLLKTIMLLGAQFFALPLEEKLTFSCKPGVASEGYGSRMLVKDDQILDWRDYFDHHTLPLWRRRPCNWPHIPSSYRKTIEEYSGHMKLLAQKLLGIISESLGLAHFYIEDAIGEPYQNVSLNYYPPCPQPELTLGLQSHSDLGAITILLQDDVGGLQVRKDGEWIAVQPLPDALVVNLADQLQIISNGKYESIEHRAVVNKSKSRMSIATFYDPSKERLIFPAPELVKEEHPALYKGVLFGDHVSAWYYRGPEGKKVLDSFAIAL